MIESKDIDAMMGAEVVDSDNDKIGKVTQVYVDSQDQHPSWVAVKTGFFGSAETLIPIADAAWDTSTLHVGVAKAKVKDAPHVDPDREITVDEQNQLYRHYGIGAEVEPGGDRPDSGEETPRAADETPATGPADETRGSDAGRTDAERGASDGPDRTGEVPEAQAEPTEKPAEADQPADEPDGVVPPDTEGGGFTVEDPEPAADEHDAPGEHSASGEHATSGETGSYRGAEQVAADGRGVTPSPAPATGSGYRMRLRKVSVTEQRTVTVTVPVTHEEVRLERVPDGEPDGPDVIRGQADVVLMAERPVVTTEQVAVEHVHVALDDIDDASPAAGSDT